ncbi:MAG: magnesium/cobalt transporter CorA [Candidatus Thorarchaeota archaeon]|nr:MAG: magnesium/cobalt transporter CorA [Candidatus Thorarchaeota archaeon]
MFETADDVPVELCAKGKENHVRWVHVNGVNDVTAVEQISEVFSIHPLITEDIVRTEQRPKIEKTLEKVFVVVRWFQFDKQNEELLSEQVSILLDSSHVISFQESEQNHFVPILERAKKNLGRIRKSGSDYLAYALIDLIVDHYFVILEDIGEKIEILEDSLTAKPSKDLLEEIYRLKRIVIEMRRHIWPLREVVSRFMRDDELLAQESTRVYLKDLYDHVYRVTDYLETYRESMTGALDIYLSSVSNRMNEVMKVLTVISTIFIPLTLMASIYGMNFQNMPELAWPFGYPALLLSMLVVGLLLLAGFRRIGWV